MKILRAKLNFHLPALSSEEFKIVMTNLEPKIATARKTEKRSGMQHVFLIQGISGIVMSLNQIFISPTHQCLPVKTLARKTLSID